MSTRTKAVAVLVTVVLTLCLGMAIYSSAVPLGTSRNSITLPSLSSLSSVFSSSTAADDAPPQDPPPLDSASTHSAYAPEVDEAAENPEPPFSAKSVVVVTDGGQLTAAENLYQTQGGTLASLRSYAFRHGYFFEQAPTFTNADPQERKEQGVLASMKLCSAIDHVLGRSFKGEDGDNADIRYILYVASGARIVRENVTVEDLISTATAGERVIVPADFEGHVVLVRLHLFSGASDLFAACKRGKSASSAESERDESCFSSVSEVHACATQATAPWSVHVADQMSGSVVSSQIDSLFEERRNSVASFIPSRHFIASFPQCLSDTDVNSRDAQVCVQMMRRNLSAVTVPSSVTTNGSASADSTGATGAASAVEETTPSTPTATTQQERTSSLAPPPPPSRASTTATTTAAAAAGEKKPLKIAVLTMVEYPVQEARKWAKQNEGNLNPPASFLPFFFTWYSWEEKLSYCKKHGYDFIIETAAAVNGGKSPHDKSPAYFKPRAISKWLPHYDWILFLDADTFITNPNLKIEDHILTTARRAKAEQRRKEKGELSALVPKAAGREQSAVGLPSDADYDLLMARDFNGVNTGVLVIKSTEWSKEFFARADQYITNGYPWSDVSCPLPEGWFEQSTLRCMLGESEPSRFPTYDNDMKHVWITENQRLMNSYVPPNNVGNMEAKYRGGDFIGHWPDAKSHSDSFMSFLDVRRDVHGKRTGEKPPPFPPVTLYPNSEHA